MWNKNSQTQSGPLDSPFNVSLTTVEFWLPCLLLARQKNWPPNEDTNTGWFSSFNNRRSPLTSNQSYLSTVGLAWLLQVRVKLVPLYTSMEGLTDTDVFLGPSVGGGRPSQKWNRLFKKKKLKKKFYGTSCSACSHSTFIYSSPEVVPLCSLREQL